MAKRKKSPLELAKDAAWTEFSKFIRTRDCIRTTLTLDRGVCVTCSREYEYKKLQAGHFLAGRTNSILLDEDLVHAQCYGCNMGQNGQYVEYFVWMEHTYGRITIDMFRLRKTQAVKLNEQEWRAKAQEYRAKTTRLIMAFNKDKYSTELQELVELGKTLKKQEA